MLGYASLLQRGLPTDDPNAKSLKVIESVIEVVSEVGVGSTFTVKLPTANISTAFKSVA